ncbi:hypothetical protein ACRRTK_000124 [Alexandromys fortis]
MGQDSHLLLASGLQPFPAHRSHEHKDCTLSRGTPSLSDGARGGGGQPRRLVLRPRDTPLVTVSPTPLPRTAIWSTHVQLDPGLAPHLGPGASGRRFLGTWTPPPPSRGRHPAAAVRQGGVLESPAVEGRCGRLPHKGGGGKAGRGGPGAGEAGRGGGGGGGDKAPAPPGRLVLWLLGSAGCTRPRRCAVLPPGSDRHLGIQARAGEYRLRGPRHWEESRDRPPGFAATGRRGGNFLGPLEPRLRARPDLASLSPEGWAVQVCPRLRERLPSSA